ncbi:MAG: leucyl/phenylalanyl-tRNA--protein transferase [Rhodospirillales bacterium]|nr:leucyl/phenylalanyl-tRNA--protein transferase [Rhodospirillales bacterium]
MARRAPAITPELLLRAYRGGYFPMAEGRGSARLYWLDPERRGILPLDRFHLPRRLARTALSAHFTITADRDFAATIAGCAESRANRPDTWINAEIEHLFTALHRQGHAHSIEVWQGEALAGGLYGVALGTAFFGESMFSRVRDASKVALVHLLARLRLAGFTLLDTQFVTPHLARFGAIEVPRAAYHAMLEAALLAADAWQADPPADAIAAKIRAMARSELEEEVATE